MTERSYWKALDRLWELVERDHGGCDQEDCSLRQAIEDRDDVLAIWLWACSGAACDEFKRLYEKHEKRICKKTS